WPGTMGQAMSVGRQIRPLKTTPAPRMQIISVMERKFTQISLRQAASPIIATRIEREIVEALTSAGLPLMRNKLHERQAYKAAFVRRLALHELDGEQVNGLSEALKNAEYLADELVDILAPAESRQEIA
ncbi:hypothetical protein AiwAL_19655, partial [Acidiphilium sp. AL]|nr:hypothetical protein [Acidiphilium sp. AL]